MANLSSNFGVGIQNITSPEFRRQQAFGKNAIAPTDVAGFQSLARTQGSNFGRNVAFGGGFLSPEDFSKATFAQKEEFTADFQTQQDAAKAANEERYADILEQFGTTIEGATERGAEVLEFNEAQFAGLGDQAKKDIAQTYTNLNASNTQNLVSSGLAGTSARGAVQSNTARGQANALGTLNEQLRRERIGQETEISRFNAETRNRYNQYLDSLTASKLSFMERRDDVGPDQALFLQQLEKFGNV